MAVLIGEQLTAWSKAGLLRRLGFVDHHALLGDGRIERMPQTILENGEVHAVDLFDWLAGNYCDLTRILAVHTDPTRNESVNVCKAAERCQHEVPARQGPQQRLVQIACYLGAPGHGEYDTRAVAPAFQNLVIVPVDQAMPGSGASPLAPRDGEHPASRFASVAAQTLATVSGAWLFQQEGALDDSTSGSAQTGVRVVRSYVRTLDVPDPVPELTDRTLNREPVDRGSGWPLPTGASSVVPANPPEHFARTAAKDLANRHREVIDLRRVSPPRVVERTSVRLLRGHPNVRFVPAHRTSGCAEAGDAPDDHRRLGRCDERDVRAELTVPDRGRTQQHPPAAQRPRDGRTHCLTCAPRR